MTNLNFSLFFEVRYAGCEPMLSCIQKGWFDGGIRLAVKAAEPVVGRLISVFVDWAGSAVRRGAASCRRVLGRFRESGRVLNLPCVRRERPMRL